MPLLTEPYPFQRKGIEFHLKHHYSLNLCKMGLGKTLMALGVADAAGGSFTVLCPAFLQENWRREIRKHLGPGREFKVLPYSVLSGGNFDKKHRPTTIIADEIHYLKNPQAKRTKTAARMLLHQKPKYFVGLTGTPIKNRISEFYSLLSMVSFNPARTSGIDVNEYFQHFDKFCKRYCYTKANIWSGGLDYYGLREDRVAEFRTLLKGKVWKVSEKDVIDLPPLIHKRFYAKCRLPEDLQQQFDGGFRGADSEAKRLSAVGKAKATREYVQNLLDQGSGAVVVFTDHIEPAKKIAKEFNVPPIIGGVSSAERMKTYDRFVKGSIPVLVATIGAFSVGVNLTNCTDLVFNDVSWVPGDNYQAMKRIHRIGQDKTCTIHYVLGGPVDERILDTLQEKIKVIDKTNDLALDLTTRET